MDRERPILVTGATGYVGGRLVPALLAGGWRVRAMGRSLDKLRRRPWAGHPRVSLAEGDVLDAPSLLAACRGCRAAFYLVHSMIARKGAYAAADRTAARHMAAAAAAAGLQRIIYLGGLARGRRRKLSAHLRSRLEVAAVLRAGPVPLTELRAPMILGSGSASFEIMRYLVEHLPVMTTPRWVFSRNQPVAVSNVLAYLAGCLENEATRGQAFDVGGPEVLTYRDLLDIYAEEAGLRRRLIIPVPVLTPTLSAYWIRLVSPVPTSIALPLTEGLTSEAVCAETRIRELIPQRLLTVREAIRRALDHLAQAHPDAFGYGDGRPPPAEWPVSGDAAWAGGNAMTCAYRVRLAAAAGDLWPQVAGLGGAGGYGYADWLWRLRGSLDRLAGGPGLGGRRRQGAAPRAGETFDFWRVLAAAPPHRLLLQSLMKAPGQATLELRLTPEEDGVLALTLTSRFFPRGLGGLMYWYALLPFHRAVFRGMLAAVARGAGSRPLSGPERL